MQRWEIPVKNTFINFDLPAPPTTAPQRSRTCPPLPLPNHSVAGALNWEGATQELCHAMGIRREPEGSVSPLEASECRLGADAPEPALETVSCSRMGNDSSSVVHQQPAGKSCVQSSEETDAISEVSTKESEGTFDSPSSLQTWTSVSTRKKKSKALKDDYANAGHYGSSDDQSMTPRPKGKGKGVSHFQRIEVGIEDDREFRVVQRLIGPRGKYMQDIVTESKGAKVWIVGRGSRSWEDDTGPLMVCVGATSGTVFDKAVGLVNDLLNRVREEYNRFSQ